MRVKIYRGPSGFLICIRGIKADSRLGFGLSGNGGPRPACALIAPAPDRRFCEFCFSVFDPRSQKVIRWILVKHVLAQGEKVAFAPDHICALA
jgi:hypothetical protein